MVPRTLGLRRSCTMYMIKLLVLDQIFCWTHLVWACLGRNKAELGKGGRAAAQLAEGTFGLTKMAGHGQV